MKRTIIALLSLVAFSLACQPPSDPKAMEEMKTRLDALEKKITALEKKGPARPKRPQTKPQTAAYKIPQGGSPFLGAKEAKVSVMVFSDFQCPFCARIDPMLHEAINDPELKGKLNVVFKHFPLSFHKDARPAAKASMAAQEQGNDKFWKMADKMLANQKALKPDNFKKWAGEIGLDVKEFEADLKKHDAKYEAAIKQDMDTGSKTARVRGTPSIFVGGWQLQQRTVDGIKALIKDKKLF